MANELYDKAREGFLGGDLDWDADTFKVVLADAADYTVDIANDEFLDDIPVGARVATSSALSGKTKVAGVADANDVTLTGVTGDGSELVIIFKDTGVEATSRLVAKIDNATNLPVTPNGGDIMVQWDNGADKIFKL